MEAVAERAALAIAVVEARVALVAARPAVRLLSDVLASVSAAWRLSISAMVAAVVEARDELMAAVEEARSLLRA